jgi:hypothetical protein
MYSGRSHCFFLQGSLVHNFEKKLIARGKNMAYCDILTVCLDNLSDHQQQAFGYITERAAAISVLRELCEKFGDNN